MKEREKYQLKAMKHLYRAVDLLNNGGMTRDATVASKSYRDNSMKITGKNLKMLNTETFEVTLTIEPSSSTKYVLNATTEQWESIGLIKKEITQGDNDNVLKLKFEVTGGIEHAMGYNLDANVPYDSKDRDDPKEVMRFQLAFIKDRLKLIVKDIQDKILKLNSRESRVK